MKRIACLALCLCIATAALTSLSACQERREVLTVCNWGEYISDGTDGYMDVIREFEKRFDVKVDYVLAETNEALYSMMKSGGGDYDVVFPSDYMIEKMIAEDMLSKLNFENIPNFKENIMPRFHNPDYDPQNEYSVPYFWGTVGIIYNTDLYEGEVDSWDALWSDGYENQILMIKNPRDAFAVVLNKLGYSINSDDPAHWREAAKELKQKRFIYVMDEFFEKMPDESAVMSVYFAGDYLSVAAENDSLAFVRPESGTNIFNDAMCVPKTSRHQALAEQFINFMLEADVGLANAEYLGYSTPNQAVYEQLDEELKNNEIAYPDIDPKWEAMRLLPAEIEELMNELWQDILSTNK